MIQYRILPVCQRRTNANKLKLVYKIEKNEHLQIHFTKTNILINIDTTNFNKIPIS